MVVTTKNNNLENRVIVFMPTGRDASLVSKTLEDAGIDAQIYADSDDLEQILESGAGALLIAEEALKDGTLDHLIDFLNRQPVWSDLPIVLFAGNNRTAEMLVKTVGTRFNATIVERPIRITILISAVRGALRARERQYQSRNLLHQLEESDRQKDLFLATLSHELRTPLNSILGWVQLLRGRSSAQIDTQEALKIIERNAKAQAEIISDILFVSRVITGKLELNLETVNLNSIIKSAIDTMRPSFESKQIQAAAFFEFNPEIRGDFDRLQQVFWNLLSNAVKFTPANGKINVRVINKNETVEIEISDSGQGIKPEFLPYVFERFRQADNSYTRAVGGLGLGLAIVRHLVELHGGSVRVSSEGENRGATFTVSLPLAVESKIEVSATDSTADTKQKAEENLMENVCILLVEDDEDSREMLKIMFEQYGIQTLTASSAAEALESVKQNQPNVLISDVGLPGEDGYELISKIRRLAPDQGGLIPAIALTGYASQQDRNLAISAGYQEHMAKPVDIDKLFELVKNLIAKEKSAKLQSH